MSQRIIILSKYESQKDKRAPGIFSYQVRYLMGSVRWISFAIFIFRFICVPVLCTLEGVKEYTEKNRK